MIFLADNNVRQAIIEALRQRGRTVLRAVDLFGEGNDDEDLLLWTGAKEDRILLSADKRMHTLAREFIDANRPFRLIYWRLMLYRDMTDGDVAEGIEEIAAKPGAFADPIEYLKRKTREAS